jgi:Tol biopolymer transport system component
MKRALCGLAATALLSFAGPAWASFPGSNGTIVYGWISADRYVSLSHTSIRTVDPRSREVTVLQDCPVRTDRFPVNAECQYLDPRYSPDGRRIAFTTLHVVPDRPWQPGVGVMAADGTAFEDHATQNSYSRPTWSPAGDRLLLTRQLGVDSFATAVFFASIDGTELGRAAPPWSAMQDWSSRGQIAFVRDRAAHPNCRRACQHIFLTRPGKRPRRLTHRGGTTPSWSPDGTELAFARIGGPRPGIYLVGRDGSDLRRVVRRGFNPAFSPDGRWIAFLRQGDIYVIRTNGRGQRRLVDEARDPGYGLGPQAVSLDWQPLPAG